ncbi:hypothetical protein [Erythrobacter longus]|nr:hypothetical protein [Erythrobacter longus]
MNSETKTKQSAAQAKAPAQSLVHGLFGRRISGPLDAAVETGELTGKAA